MFIWEFSSLTQGILVFILLSCLKHCVLGLSGLLDSNAVIILPLYCNAIIVFVRGCIGYHSDGLLSQLLVALHPLVLFIAMLLTSDDAGYD